MMMMKHTTTMLWLAALLAAAPAARAQAPAPASQPAALPSSPAKKELAQRLITLQQGAIENMSRNVIGRPVALLMQRAGGTLQAQVPADKREAVGRTIEADVRRFVDEAVPLLRDRALKIAPSSYGAALEERFTEDELKQVVAWLESPVNKKFQQLGPEMESVFSQKLQAEADGLLGARLQALNNKVAAALGVPASPPAAASGARAADPKPKAAK